MKTFNLFGGATRGDESDPPGFRARSAQLGPLLGAARLGMTVYELPPGQATCPYHFHWGDEEWLIVVAGTPTLRTPEDATALLETTVQQVRTGQIAPAVANSVGYLISVALKSFELDVLRRLDELERARVAHARPVRIVSEPSR